ncbi:HAD-IIB family hydrolase [Sulfitobacter albidus]|uniref:HAD-IIB family hydrolase n=1 Tax=Sulfitobacter albidus TaxID=2829501 RepID=A0A975PMT2_9RHOB|nr:HAD-IIB family hydrolase [Sulfitobacter albidus]QUJ76746.1 HAD-IIB family hydrolase [Sulfitobacter albidus]
MKLPPLLVFSDLDGTLLDHETYDWSPARPALARLAALGAPVILTSSKTAAEITVLQEAMDLHAHPAIVENGAGVIGLGGETAGDEYKRLRALLDDLPTDLRAPYTGFGDMTDAEVAAQTGLPREDAGRARDRRFSEPGLWHGSDAGRTAFISALGDKGVHAREGGRYLTLSFGRTKGDAMAQVRARYPGVKTLALGDAPNDTEMLEAADYGVIIANPHRAPLPPLKGEAAGRILRSAAPGPKGWTDSVCGLLDRLGHE